MSLLVSLCGRLKCIQKSPGDNEVPAFLLSLSEPLAEKKAPLHLATVSVLDPETLVAGVPDGGLSNPGSRRLPALGRDHRGGEEARRRVESEGD